jgi:spore coat protein CotF
MSVYLTQKERTLIQDLQKHEETCIQKYQENAAKAQDPALKQLFNQHLQHEQQHYQTLEQILNGQVPNINQQNQQGQQMVQQQAYQGEISNVGNQQDAFLCNDLLMAEKYVSGAYDTAIFEFRNSNLRQALNHIQKEEQQHGKDIFNYMESHGMYNPQ